VVEPGQAAYEAIVERFGPRVVADDGTLDRARLAGVVFDDEAARKDLESITHPAIGQVMVEQMNQYRDSERVVILDIPLLAEKGRMGVQAVIVVDCPEEIAVERLVEFRDFDPADARRRIAAQLSRDDRRKLADIVVDNSGTPDALAKEVDRVWDWLSSLPEPVAHDG
jgi:dephospho-CoA kinase